MKPTKSKEKHSTILVKNVSKNYDSIPAVADVSFTTYQGEIIALLGPNGAGKSTLMNMISGFLAPSSGDIFVNGLDVSKEDIAVKKNIGFLPEGAPMYADMSVRLFLEYMIELKLSLTESEERTSKNIKSIYADELNRISRTAKITEVMQQKIETLSKGYLRRVGFAQSIIGAPSIMLLDEPTDGLDPNQKEHIRALIKEMGKEKTIVISTHLLDEAETIASRIIFINNGRIVADGKLKDVLRQTKCETLGEAFRVLTSTEGTYDE